MKLAFHLGIKLGYSTTGATFGNGLDFSVKTEEPLVLSTFEEIKVLAFDNYNKLEKEIVFTPKAERDSLKEKLETKIIELMQENRALMEYIPIKKRWEDEMEENFKLKKELEFYKNKDFLLGENYEG